MEFLVVKVPSFATEPLKIEPAPRSFTEFDCLFEDLRCLAVSSNDSVPWAAIFLHTGNSVVFAIWRSWCLLVACSWLLPSCEHGEKAWLAKRAPFHRWFAPISTRTTKRKWS